METVKNAKFPRPPINHIMPNNKLINKLTELDDFIGKDFSLIVSSRKAKEQIRTQCLLNYDDEYISIYGGKPFTEYDRCVLNAVTSLYNYGQSNIITPAIVYRAMTGQTNTSCPSKQQLEAVKDSLDKMRFMHCYIDCKEELQQRKAELNGKQIKGGECDTYLLAMSRIKIELCSGECVEGYEVLQPPILYEYAQKTGQVVTAPAQLLNIPNIADNRQRIEVKGYLLRRILAMQGKTAKSNRILFDSVLEAIRADKTNRAEKKRVKDYCVKVLDYWQSVGAVKEYKLIKSGCSAAGIDVLM